MADVTINQLTGQVPTGTDIFPFATTGVTPSTYKASLAQIKTGLGLATVATTGSYTDLINTPTIPTAQIQSDWTQTSTGALDYIKNKPTIPKFAYAIFSQSGSSPYAITLIASKNVASITANSTNANITVNWSSNYFDSENYCVTFGAGSNYCGNRSSGVNLVCSSEGTKTRNSVVFMAGSSSSGGFVGNNYINVMAIQ